MCCINKIDKIMKRLICAVSAAMLLVQGCSKTDSGYSDDRVDTSVQGRMSVVLTYEYPVGKSLGDYDFVLSEESLVTDIQVLVFDGVKQKKTIEKHHQNFQQDKFQYFLTHYLLPCNFLQEL